MVFEDIHLIQSHVQKYGQSLKFSLFLYHEDLSLQSSFYRNRFENVFFHLNQGTSVNHEIGLPLIGIGYKSMFQHFGVATL